MAALKPASLLWLLRHEVRLFMRQGESKGSSIRWWGKVALTALLLGGGHLLGWFVADLIRGLPPGITQVLLSSLSIWLLLLWAVMLSHALTSTAQNLYARGDTDLLLSSPVSFPRVVLVRALALGVSVSSVYCILAMPIANMCALLVHPRWLAIYPVVIGLGFLAAGLGIALCVGLFALIGPARARIAVQVLGGLLSMVIVVAIQFGDRIPPGLYRPLVAWLTVLSGGAANDRSSLIWLPARALLGDPASMVVLVAAGFAACAASAVLLGRRYAKATTEAAGAARSGRPHARTRAAGGPAALRTSSPRAVLRRKEVRLVLRDPWLISQIGMQLLAMLPLYFIVFRDGSGEARLYLGAGILALLIGQIAGALAWITLSGEDAPDVLASAPVPPREIVRAKVEAIALLLAPLAVAAALVLLRLSPRSALAALAGVASSALAAILIQVWSRIQSRRRDFALRYKTGKAAYLIEFVVLIALAVATGLAAYGTIWTLLPAAIALLLLAIRYLLRPAAA